MSNEQQARIDALADAQTLWRVLTGDRLYRSARYKLGWLAEADEFGSEAISEIGRGNAKNARLYACLAARAAFRAVTGLRGGK